MTVWMRRLASILMFVVCVRGGSAVAQTGAVASVEALNKKAISAYRAGKAKVARQHLLSALVIAEDNDLGRSRAAARTYLNLGVVNLVGLRQRQEAIHCFQLALQIAPALQPPGPMASPRVKQAMAEARRRIKRSARRAEVAAAPAAEPDQPAAGKSKEALGDVEPLPAASAGADPEPADEPAGRTLAAARSEDEEEVPVSMEESRLRAREDAGSAGRGPGTIFLGLGIGSAVGASPTRPLELHTNRSVKAGPAFGGLLHVLPELGVQVSRSLALSLQGRHQYIHPSGGPDPVGKAPKMAHAALACLYYTFTAGETVDWVATAAVGGGSGFRLKVQPAPQAGVITSDTVAGGPLIFGPGLALQIHAGDSVIISPSLRVLAGAPNLAAVAEGALGMQYAF
jgi:hypothetical protein